MANLEAARRAAKLMKDALDQRHGEWKKGRASGDFNATVDLMFANKCTLIAPGGQTVSGKDGVKEFLSKNCKAGEEINFKIDETNGDAAFAFERGLYTVKEGGKDTDKGKYIIVWKKEDGDYRIYQFVWNTSLPPAS